MKKPSMSQYIRDVLKTVPDPDTARTPEILPKVKELMNRDGIPGEPNSNLVNQVKHEIRRVVDGKITKKGIEEYERYMNKPPSTNGVPGVEPQTPASPQTYTPPREAAYTTYQGIRDALKQVDDPDTCPLARLLAIARARLQQEGNDKAARKIESKTVSKCRCELQEKIGKPLTREKIEQYEKDNAHHIDKMRSAKFRFKASKKKHKKVDIKQDAPVKEKPITMTHLRQGVDFARNMGGLENASAVLRALREVVDECRN